MAKLIKYKAQCIYCAKWCEKNQAYLQMDRGKWFCHCFECYEKKKLKEK